MASEGEGEVTREDKVIVMLNNYGVHVTTQRAVLWILDISSEKVKNTSCFLEELSINCIYNTYPCGFPEEGSINCIYNT